MRASSYSCKVTQGVQVLMMGTQLFGLITTIIDYVVWREEIICYRILEEQWPQSQVVVGYKGRGASRDKL